MTEPRDAYKVLQVDPEADLDVIQAAYRRLAQKHHPDLTREGAAGTAAQRMVEINTAWDQVRDPVKRASYDRQRALAATASTAAIGQSPQSGRAPTTSPRAATSGPQAGSMSSAPDGLGSAGAPPGRPSGSVLNFGRYAGWSLGEIGRNDPGYLEWLDRMPIGRPYRAELDAMLRRLGRRLGEQAQAAERRGLFRRR